VRRTRIAGRNGMPIREANLRISSLSRESVMAGTEKENLDVPLDGDIQVTGELPHRKVSLMVGAQEVSWAVLVDFQQQIGDCLVRMAGLASVGTHDDHRFRGYSRRVLINWMRLARREGYDVALLFGIKGFYPKFGYAEAFPGVIHKMAVGDAERGASGGLKFVEYRPEHHAAVLKMYHQNNAGRTGPTLRGAKWKAFPGPGVERAGRRAGRCGPPRASHGLRRPRRGGPDGRPGSGLGGAGVLRRYPSRVGGGRLGGAGGADSVPPAD